MTAPSPYDYVNSMMGPTITPPTALHRTPVTVHGHTCSTETHLPTMNGQEALNRQSSITHATSTGISNQLTTTHDKQVQLQVRRGWAREYRGQARLPQHRQPHTTSSGRAVIQVKALAVTNPLGARCSYRHSSSRTEDRVRMISLSNTLSITASCMQRRSARPAGFRQCGVHKR